MWTQHYTLLEQSDFASALLAAIPIVVVLVLLGLARTTVWLAGLAGLLASAVVAIGLGRMPVSAVLGAGTYGAAFGVFPILWIIFWALVLFRITVQTGRFDLIKCSIQSVTSDSMGQALLIAFGFEAFLEGAAGFGTPVAIAASILVGLGFTPFRAAVICLLANTAPVAFGSLGIPLITLAGTTGLPLHALSVYVAILSAPLAFVMPAYMVMVAGGIASLRRALAPALVCGAIFAATQVAIANYLGPQLADMIAAVFSIAGLLLIFRFSPRRPQDASLKRAFRGNEISVDELALPNGLLELSARNVFDAWMPYILLVFFVLLWSTPMIRALLERVTFRIAWPGLDGRVLTGPPLTHGAQIYGARFVLNPLAAAGTACMAAAVSTAVYCRMRAFVFIQVLAATLRQMAIPAATVCIVLAMAFLMNYSGETAIIGLALAHTGAIFPLCSAVLGWLGVFLTGSDTSSNALFGNLQVVTASRLGFNPVIMAASNSVGGVVGKMISLQTIAVAAAATGLDHLAQNRLFRKMLRHSLVLTAFAGLIALIAVRVISR